jgi:hypothetical protein
MATTKETKAEIVAAEVKKLADEKVAPPAAPAANPDLDKARRALTAAQKEAAQKRDAHSRSAGELQRAENRVREAQAAVDVASVVKLPAPDGLIATHAGLPNSCHVCGNAIEGSFWYAVNEDAARAGSGMCKADAEKFSDTWAERAVEAESVEE